MGVREKEKTIYIYFNSCLYGTLDRRTIITWFYNEGLRVLAKKQSDRNAFVNSWNYITGVGHNWTDIYNDALSCRFSQYGYSFPK